MKNFKSKLCLSLLLLFFSAVSAWATEIQVLYVSRMPELVPIKKDGGGLAELGTLVKKIRKENAFSIFLHGGDSLAPSAMSSFDHGTHMIDILNSLEPEVMAINEREFAYKEDELVLRLSEAAFPFVSSNIYDPYTEGNLEGAEITQCFEYGEHEVCVISVVDPLVSETFLPDRVQVYEGYKAVKDISANLKAKGADLIILLSGYEFDGLTKLIEEEIVDVVLHSTRLKHDAFETVGSGFYGGQAGKNGNALLLKISINEHDKSRKVSYAANIVPLKDYQPDVEIQEKIAYYTNKLSQIMDVEVGTTTVELDTTKNAVRTKENAFGNLIADAFRYYYDADVGFVNGGSIRGDRIYPPGTVLTRKNIQSEQPFQNESKMIVVTGQQLWDAMENSVSQVEEVKGRFLHLSGMELEYCLDAPPGERVRNLKVGGSAIDLEKNYTLGSCDYLTYGGDGFTMLKDSPRANTQKWGLLTWTIVRSYIEEKGTIAPGIEGRIKNVCEGNN